MHEKEHMQMQQESGLSASPSTSERRGKRGGIKTQLESIFTNKKLLCIDRKRVRSSTGTKKKEKDGVLKGLTANIPATDSSSLPPILSPFVKLLASAFGSKQGGSEQPPLTS